MKHGNEQPKTTNTERRRIVRLAKRRSLQEIRNSPEGLGFGVPAFPCLARSARNLIYRALPEPNVTQPEIQT